MRFWRRRKNEPGERPRAEEHPTPFEVLAARYGHPRHLTETQKQAAIKAVAWEFGFRPRGEEQLMCRSVRICAEIGEGCLCPENPIAPAMWGRPPPGWVDDRLADEVER